MLIRRKDSNDDYVVVHGERVWAFQVGKDYPTPQKEQIVVVLYFPFLSVRFGMSPTRAEEVDRIAKAFQSARGFPEEIEVDWLDVQSVKSIADVLGYAFA